MENTRNISKIIHGYFLRVDMCSYITLTNNGGKKDYL
jgi:hypothetical protein